MSAANAARRPQVLILAAIVVAIIGVVAGLALNGNLGPAGRPGGNPGSGGPGQAAAGDCPQPTVSVANAAELQAALTNPEPGAVISLAAGVYAGNFTATGDGTPELPVTVCGTGDSVLDGGQVDDGYVFHLNRASHWVLQGFAVRNGQKGLVVDETTHSVVRGLAVSNTGDEAIHLRKFSSDNKVLGNSIKDTGRRKTKFGEGIYIGTAKSNWCEISSCEADRSDRNEVTGNNISATSAECVDIKEGTTGGFVRDNHFDGSAIVGADSWVDVKGNGWTIENNTGRHSPLDGFQTHEILDGWGTGNVFRNNTAEVNGPGFGYSLSPVRDNVVECSNRASQAGKGVSNEPC